VSARLAVREGALKVPEVRAYLDRHRPELLAMLERGDESGLVLARRHSKLMDGLLTTLFPLALAVTKAQGLDVPVHLAAVGGYGRELLALKSDLDVRLLTHGSPERIAPIAEALLYPLWDAGVSIGHQVVTIADAIEDAKQDLPTATALLDWRVLAGDSSLGTTLHQSAFAGVFSDGGLTEFIGRLENEVAERHRRYGDSVFILEPDVKSGTGGVRDLDVALWAARARWRAADLPALVRLGVLVTREAEEIQRAADFLWKLRNHLHHHAGRRSDRLTFDEQEHVAKAMGYRERIGAHAGATEAQIEGAMVEALMSDYYRHARAVTRGAEQIIARATPHVGQKRPQEVDLGGGLRSFDGQITVADISQLTLEPSLALRLYVTAVARQTRVLPFARQAIARAAADPVFGAALRADKDAASLFVGLVSTAQQTKFKNGSILAELHDVGLLVAMIPEFAPVIGRVHHDTYHVYTVDVHSVAAVDRLRALVRGDVAKEYPLACRLAAEVTRPEVLFLATLLHDVGKAIGGKDHSRRGAEMAIDILARLGLAPDDVEEACHLIRQHLVMYLIAARRDLGDPVTVQEFAREVHGRDGLRDLFLLTVADLSTTSPTSMTTWKAHMLDQLYVATDAMLSETAVSTEGRVLRVRAAVKEIWGNKTDAAFLDEFLDTMPERYLLSNTPAEIASHAAVALGLGGDPVNAALVPSRMPEVAELCVVTGEGAGHGLCVVTGDRPGLLAAITAAIAASRLEVYAAQIHSRRLPMGGVQAVDLFWLRDRSDGAEGVARAMPKLQRDLQSVISGAVAPKDLATPQRKSPWSERPSPMITTHVSIDNRASAAHTVIEVMTKDRPGLLYTLSQALHEMSLTIAIAKINTEGTRVADVFYITEADGSKLEPGQRTEMVREGLIASLGPRVAPAA